VRVGLGELGDSAMGEERRGHLVANIQHSVKEDRRLVASERAERQSIESVFDIAKASTDPGESISEHLDGLACMLWGNEIPQCLP
jgi:hypothetical protein